MSVPIYLSKCVYQSWACPCYNPSLIQARITKFGPEVETPLLRSLLFWGSLTLTFKVKFDFKVKILWGPVSTRVNAWPLACLEKIHNSHDNLDYFMVVMVLQSPSILYAYLYTYTFTLYPILPKGLMGTSKPWISLERYISSSNRPVRMGEISWDFRHRNVKHIHMYILHFIMGRLPLFHGK